MKLNLSIFQFLTSRFRILAIPVVLSLASLTGCEEAPVALVEMAKLSLDRAETAQAKRYAPVTFARADSLISQAGIEIGRQKGRLAPFRDYALADSLLRLADTLAVVSRKKANDSIAYLHQLVSSQMSALGRDLGHWENEIDDELAALRLKKRWQQANMAHSTSRSLFTAREYESALKSLAKVRASLDDLADDMETIAHSDAGKLPVWRRWVSETLEQSRQSGDYAIVVDKSARRTYLVRAGKLIRTYDCELGYNSGGQKLRAGDGATPEGQYYVTMYKNRGSSYYKALPINFPNESDRKRFAENKANGVIARLSRIGGNIEIHGHGGKGRDWTEGCVALSNNDMDHIMQFARVGTPVTIVRRSDMWPGGAARANR